MTPNTAYVGQRVGYYPDGSKTKTGTVLAVSPLMNIPMSQPWYNGMMAHGTRNSP